MAATDVAGIAEAVQRVEGIGMQTSSVLAKLSKGFADRTTGLESMMMQAAMNAAKTASRDAETQERMEGMAMTNATNMAKFQRGVNEKFEELMQTLVEELASASMGGGASAAPAPAPAVSIASPLVGKARHVLGVCARLGLRMHELMRVGGCLCTGGWCNTGVVR